MTDRRLHPLTLLFTGISIARGFVLPALVGGVSAARGDLGSAFTWVLLLAGIPALLAAVAKYASFRYRTSGDELVIDSGVLSKHHRVIPLSRVQNIDIRQTALQRLLGVAELRVETASGGASAEAELSVLGRATAETLRNELLRIRHSALAASAAGPPLTAAELPSAELPSAETLARLSPAQLALAGATANEAGLIVAALAGASQIFDDLPVWDWAPIERLVTRIPHDTAMGTALSILFVLAALFVVGWVLSVVGSVVGYFDFTLDRAGEELRKRYGLLSRREGSIPLARVQALRIEESLLRRPLGLAAIKIETAGSSPGQRQRGGAEAFIPIATVRDLSRLVAGVFADADYSALDFRPVHPRSRRRALTRYAILLLALAILLALAPWSPRIALLPLLLLPFAWLLARWQYRHRGYALAAGYVVARNGVLNRVTWIVPERKLQTVHLTETPFQRRHGLASVIIDTAAGGRAAVVRDLGLADAERLVGRLAPRAV